LYIHGMAARVLRGVAEKLREKGVRARVEEREGGEVLIIEVAGETAEIRVESLQGGTLRLSLRYPAKRGVTLLSCNADAPLRCAEQLIEAISPGKQ